MDQNEYKPLTDEQLQELTLRIANQPGRVPECLLSYDNYKRVVNGEIPCPSCGMWCHKEE